MSMTDGSKPHTPGPLAGAMELDANKRPIPGTPDGGGRQSNVAKSPQMNPEKIARLSAVKHQIGTPPPLPAASSSQAESSKGNGGDQDLKEMMTKMMGMIDNLSNDMSSVKLGVEEAREKAQEAVHIAQKTEATVETLQEKMVTKETVKNMIENTINEKLAEVRDQIPKSPTADDRNYTLVITGLGDMDNEADAVEWVAQKLK